MSQWIPFKLEPQYRDYVWGGDRLRPGYSPTAEAWIMDENDRIVTGDFSGKTLGEVAAEFGEAVLGRDVTAKTGNTVPLLIKLLDCNQWLSVQVHPDDSQAVALEGAGARGKTEAWYMMDAQPGAKIIAGLQPGITAEGFAGHVNNGTVLEAAQMIEVTRGSLVFMPAGTIHALGPGLFVYEVQENSNITYRVYDWGRPQTSGRMLHIGKSLAVTRPEAEVKAVPSPAFVDGQITSLISCNYFQLRQITADQKVIKDSPAGKAFHVLTVVEGAARVACAEHAFNLEAYETLFIPAASAEYMIFPHGKTKLLQAKGA